MNRRAVTLVEWIFGLLLIGLLVTAVFRLLESGLRSSSAARQRMDGLRMAANLLDSIGSDIERSLTVEIPGTALAGTGLLILQTFGPWTNGLLDSRRVSWSATDPGVARKSPGPSGETEIQMFCKGYAVDLQFGVNDLKEGTTAVRVVLRLHPSSADSGGTVEPIVVSGLFSLPLSRLLRETWAFPVEPQSGIGTGQSPVTFQGGGPFFR